MAVYGIKRYIELFKNTQNPLVYFSDKLKTMPELIFITKPFPIKVRVPKRLMLIFKEIFMSDVYSIKEITNELNEDSVVLDIGANVGFFSLLLLSKKRVKRIIAFEPIPINIQALKRTISENKLLQEKLALVEKAVTGNPVGDLTLYLDNEKELTENASVISGFESTHAEKLIVPSITLTQIFQENGLSQIDFVKMDCEGSEFDILYHTEISLLKKIKKMILEVHDMDTQKNNTEYMSQFLRSAGFEISYYRLSGKSHVISAHRKTVV
jgi:FkbM family methyltransferase